MRLRQTQVLPIFGSLLLAFLTAGKLEAITLPPHPGCLTAVPTPTCAEYHDFVSYAVPLLGISIQSSPGHIQDALVFYTGTNNQQVVTNAFGLPNALSAPSGNTSSFTGTWGGASLSDLEAALSTSAIPNPTNILLFFNHNETGGDGLGGIDLELKGTITISGPALPTLTWYFDAGADGSGAGQPFGIALGEIDGVNLNLGANEVADVAYIFSPS